MKYILACFTLCLFTFKCISQNTHEYVSIVEKKVGKRTDLYAVNTGNNSYDVFLMVDTEDFRRSSSRPVLKTIPPNSEVKMITLIKLKGKKGKYTYTLVVNEIGYELNVRKDHEDFQLKIDNALKNKKVTLYTKDSCNLCITTKRLLENNYIKYDEFNIDKDSTHLIRLIKDYKRKNIDTRTYSPVIKIEDSLYTKVKSKNDLIKALKNHF